MLITQYRDLPVVAGGRAERPNESCCGLCHAYVVGTAASRCYSSDVIDMPKSRTLPDVGGMDSAVSVDINCDDATIAAAFATAVK